MSASFLTEVDAANGRNKRRRRRLEQLNIWRNAVVHQNFKLKPAHEAIVKSTNPHHIFHVRRWRLNCGALAHQFDRVVRAHVSGVVGGTPWE